MIVITRNRQSRPIVGGQSLGRIAQVALDATGGGAGALGVAFVDDDQMRGFHRDFLQKDSTTDVLSFARDDEDFDDEDSDYRGDVIICTDQAARQARDLGIPYQAELAILTLHGVVHLLGYDHTSDSGEMTRLEEALRPVALRGGFR